MIILFTNRHRVSKKTSVRSFSNQPGKHLRMVSATKKSGVWQLAHFDDEARYSEQLANLYTQEDNDWPWVFFVHGFNHSIHDNLEQIHKLIEHHQVNVVGFSWPSLTVFKGGKLVNLGLYKKRYRVSQNRARLSAPMLKRSLDLTTRLIHDNALSISCMIHSLGNYLLQSMVENEQGAQSLAAFNNVILSQADVDFEGHQQWLESVACAGHRYCITNWQDIVLSVSNSVNKKRLGHSIDHIANEHITYADYTDAIGVGGGSTHGAFKVSKRANPHIHAMVRSLIHPGQNASFEGFDYIDASNTYQIKKRYGNEFGPARRVQGGRARHRLRLEQYRTRSRPSGNRYL